MPSVHWLWIAWAASYVVFTCGYLCYWLAVRVWRILRRRAEKVPADERVDVAETGGAEAKGDSDGPEAKAG